MEVVKDVLDFYWQEVRASLSGLKHQRVHLTNLGDFTIKHWKLDDKIRQIENFEEANKLKGLSLINARFRTAEVLYDLKGMKRMLTEEEQRKEFVKLHKTAVHATKRKHNSDMEKQGSDPGGSDE